MARKKLTRFAELKELSNVLEIEHILENENWIQNHFGNNCPLILELGCGRGEYTLALARHYQNRNVLGVDKKGARLWKGARKALEEGVQNVAFLRIKIEDLFDRFEAVQVEEIWIPFPDPLPKRRQAKHRVISAPFMDSYRAMLRPGGRVHLKTDDESLIRYLFRLLLDYPAVIHCCEDDIYAHEPLDPLMAVRTTYERRHLEAGKTIKYVCFSFAEPETAE
jgi:tRNA (guanine-N7-)-methyltransferase